MQFANFPIEMFDKSLDFAFESVHSDFDQQAASYSGIDFTYTQLTEGKFEGRLFSADLGDTAIYIESCNQAIEREIKLSDDKFSFLVVLEGQSPALKYGVMESQEVVYILPPSGEAVTISPPNGVTLVTTIDRDALLENGLLLSDAADWLTGLDKQGEFIKSKALADRLRSEATLALETASEGETLRMRGKAAELMIHGFAAAVTLEWLKPQKYETFKPTPAYERYRQLRDYLRSEQLVTAKDERAPKCSAGSKRSVELAFSELVSMGPRTYARVARLHNARRRLLDKKTLSRSIGDIAAEEGFWDWSKFSTYYRRQFGELPSDTRYRLAD